MTRDLDRTAFTLGLAVFGGCISGCAAVATDTGEAPNATATSALTLPSEGLVAHFPFSNSLTDASGAGTLLENHGATFGPDRFGDASGALEFSGRAYLKAEVPLSYGFSWSFWLKDTSTDSRTAIWLSTTEESWNPITTWLGEVGRGVGLRLQSGTSGSPIAQSVRWKDGQWHAFAVVADGSETRVYLDGAPLTRAAFTPATSSLYLGSSAFEFLGALDDVRVYDRPLSDAGVAELAREKPGPAPSEPCIHSSDIMNLQDRAQIIADRVYANKGSLGPSARVRGSFFINKVSTEASAQVDGDFTYEVGNVLGDLTVLGRTVAGTYTPPFVTPTKAVFTTTESVSVQTDATLELAPGAYGDVNLGDRAVLRLRAGHYQLSSLRTSHESRVVADASGGAVQLDVRNSVVLWDRTRVEVEHGAPAALSLYSGSTFVMLYDTAVTGSITTPNVLHTYDRARVTGCVRTGSVMHLARDAVLRQPGR
jgi:hypothetical protein